MISKEPNAYFRGATEKPHSTGLGNAGYGIKIMMANRTIIFFRDKGGRICFLSIALFLVV